ncbi:MAG TPA: hypothetical protein VEN30_04780 [Paraburkholderia sp.]|nr:hypothetical protein [Paraburkholderia sp.]
MSNATNATNAPSTIEWPISGKKKCEANAAPSAINITSSRRASTLSISAKSRLRDEQITIGITPGLALGLAIALKTRFNVMQLAHRYRKQQPSEMRQINVRLHGITLNGPAQSVFVACERTPTFITDP